MSSKTMQEKDEKWVKLPPLNKEMAETHPNKARYVQLHGNKVIPEQWFDGSIKPYKNLEEVYAACLKKGVTWEELLNYQAREDIVM